MNVLVDEQLHRVAVVHSTLTLRPGKGRKALGFEAGVVGHCFDRLICALHHWIMIDDLCEPDRNQPRWAQQLPAQAFSEICYRRAG
jgi:hypothetical protein